MPMLSNLFGSGRTVKIACAADRSVKMQCTVEVDCGLESGELAPSV